MLQSSCARKAGGLLQTALDYQGRFGWSIIPVRGKRPACARWKQYQTRAATRAELSRLFDRPDVTGLAVVHGPVSGGLVCRDFDDPAAYADWKEKHPTLARMLPTAKTHRGYHVFFRGPDGFDDYGDGEYRGDAGHYTVLPPSGHPDGGRYVWLIPPGKTIPRIGNPVKKGLRRRCKTRTEPAPLLDRKFTQRTQQDTGHAVLAVGTVSAVSTSSVGKNSAQNLSDSARATLEAAIRATLPTAPGKRNLLVLNLCRYLKAIPEVANLPASALRPVVQDWHRQALPVIRTEDFAETWADFIRAWSRVKFPIGQGKVDEAMRRAEKHARTPPPWLVELYGEQSKAVPLALLCRVLQKGKPAGEFFFLDYRTAGRLLGVSHTSAGRLLSALCTDGVLHRGEVGSQERHRATEYHYIGRPAPETDGRLTG